MVTVLSCFVKLDTLLIGHRASRACSTEFGRKVALVLQPRMSSRWIRRPIYNELELLVWLWLISTRQLSLWGLHVGVPGSSRSSPWLMKRIGSEHVGTGWDRHWTNRSLVFSRLSSEKLGSWALWHQRRSLMPRSTQDKTDKNGSDPIQLSCCARVLVEKVSLMLICLEGLRINKTFK